jgi:hypothetical protein
MGVVLATGSEEYVDPDSIAFNEYANAILTGPDWLMNPVPSSWRPPGYPLFIAAIYAVFGLDNFMAVYIFQAFIGTFLCLFIYKLSSALFHEKQAMLPFVWSGFYVFYLQYAAILMRETLVFVLLISFFYFLYLCLSAEGKRTKHMWLAVLLYALLIHTDPRYLFYLPFFIILFIGYLSFKQGLKSYLVFLLLTLVFLVPWTVRNYLAYEGFVLINTKTLDLRPKEKRSKSLEKRLKFNVFHFGDITESDKDYYPTEEERENIKKGFNPQGRTEEELKAIRKDVYPASSFLERKWVWFKEFWRPFSFTGYYFPFPDTRFRGKWSVKHNVASVVCYGTLLPLMLIAFFLLIKRKNKAWLFLIFPLVVQNLLHVIQWARERYRIPVDAFIMITAFYAVFHIYVAWKKRRDKESGG